MLALLTNGNVWRSLDAGRTWKRVTLETAPGTTKGVRHIAIAPGARLSVHRGPLVLTEIDHKHILLPGYGKNLWYSNDGGQSFTHTLVRLPSVPYVGVSFP